MIIRSAKVIFVTDCLITLCTVVTSLLGARALGPAGRGDLLVIALWPLVIAMLAALGLPNAYRYWMAKEPERCSRLFSNSIIYTVIVSAISIALADAVIPHLVGERSPQVMTLVRIYQVNIPAALFLNLMRGLLEGTKRFGWAGMARLLSFIVQGAAIKLDGTHSLRTKAVDLSGVVLLDATVSETMTGYKSWLLKPFDGLFKKNGAGTRLVITVAGSQDQPKVALDVGKTLKGKSASAEPATAKR